MNHRFAAAVVLLAAAVFCVAQDNQSPSVSNTTAVVRAFIDDEAPGWRSLTEADFTKVNSADGTWSWKDGVLHCTGQPVSVQRTSKGGEGQSVNREYCEPYGFGGSSRRRLEPASSAS